MQSCGLARNDNLFPSFYSVPVTATSVFSIQGEHIHVHNIFLIIYYSKCTVRCSIKCNIKWDICNTIHFNYAFIKQSALAKQNVITAISFHLFKFYRCASAKSNAIRVSRHQLKVKQIYRLWSIFINILVNFLYCVFCCLAKIQNTWCKCEWRKYYVTIKCSTLSTVSIQTFLKIKNCSHIAKN